MTGRFKVRPLVSETTLRLPLPSYKWSKVRPLVESKTTGLSQKPCCCGCRRCLQSTTAATMSCHLFRLRHCHHRHCYYLCHHHHCHIHCDCHQYHHRQRCDSCFVAGGQSSRKCTLNHPSSSALTFSPFLATLVALHFFPVSKSVSRSFELA